MANKRREWIRYAPTEREWIRANATLPRAELHAEFVKTFGRRDVTVENIKALCTREGWKTGRDGRIQPGHVPANKGKTMPFNANSARTQFKKGSRTGRANLQYKPIGTERLSKEGYLERKIHDGLPMQSRWRAVHLLNWEAANGPIPKGHCLKCLDGNKANTDLSNWQMIPRGALQKLNHRKRKYDYDQLAPEARPAALAIANVRYAGDVARRNKKEKQS